MSSGFLDFAVGVDDADVGKKTKRFVPKDDTTYRFTLGWYSVPLRGKDGNINGWDDDAAWNKDDTISENAVVRFTGCERVFAGKGVGYVLFKGPAYAQFGQPRQTVATILISWPVDDEGELDVAKYAAGKGYAVQPFVFSTDKYNILKKQNKKFPLMTVDVSAVCPENGGEFHKLTFSPEDSNLFHKLLNSEKEEYQAIAQSIRKDIANVAAGIQRELARDMTVDEIKEAKGEEPASPTGSSNHAAKDVDDMLKGVI